MGAFSPTDEKLPRSPSRGRSRAGKGIESRSWSGSNSPRSPGRSSSRSRSRSRSGDSRYRSERSRGRSFSRDYSSRSRSPAQFRWHSPHRAKKVGGKIVVDNLTSTVNTRHVREIFGAYGPIAYVDFARSRLRGVDRSISCAYVQYEYPEDSPVAVKHMDGGVIDGRDIAVKLLRPKRNQSPPRDRGLPQRVRGQRQTSGYSRRPNFSQSHDRSRDSSRSRSRSFSRSPARRSSSYSRSCSR